MTAAVVQTLVGLKPIPTVGGTGTVEVEGLAGVTGAAAPATALALVVGDIVDPYATSARTHASYPDSSPRILPRVVLCIIVITCSSPIIYLATPL